jgi:hypothetical protein
MNASAALSMKQAKKIADELVKQRSGIFTPEGILHGDPEALRKAIADEPDLRIIQEMLTKHLQNYADHNFVNDRVGEVKVSANPKFRDRENIVVGGWLMTWNLENRALPGTLVRVIGKTKTTARFVVRHFIGGKWEKERVLMEPDDYRVVSDVMARKIAPEAFLPVDREAAKRRSAAVGRH